MDKPKYLYHGSQYKLDILIPHTATGLPEENGTEFGVYAYEKPEMVRPFTLDIKPYQNGTMSFHGDDLTGITTIIAGTLDENSKGYIYKVSSDSFDRLDDLQWISKIPVIPLEIEEICVKNFTDIILFKGSAKDIHDIAESIACCGLVCNLCHLADKCEGCKSEKNCCGVRKNANGCYQYDCCAEKGIEGCWECDNAPCDKGMFSDDHDVRLRAFIKYIRENSKNRLAEKLYFNMKNGIYYGHDKDYDGLGSIEKVIAKLDSGVKHDFHIKSLTIENVIEYAEVICKSFATVAKNFKLTKENCPRNPSFYTNEELENKYNGSYYPFGCFNDNKIIGFVSINNKSNGVFSLNNIAVLPEYRHFGCGKMMLDFCKEKVKELGGNKIEIEIIEDNSALKNWYIKNGFVHTGIKKFDHLPFTVGFMEMEI